MKQCIALGLVATSAPLVGETASLRVSDDGRRLVETGGGPFFWLGDTAWELFHRLDRGEAQHYLDRRAAQGFTVIQAVVLAESDGLRRPNAYGEVPFHDLDPRQPNEAYFEHVDFIVREAARRGLYVAMLPTWGDKVPSDRAGTGPVVFNRENAHDFGRYLGSRYRAQPIVWMIGGDRSVSADSFDIWRALARGLREGDGGEHLITFHPAGEETSATWFHNEPWLDFNVYQSGHRLRFHPIGRYTTQLSLLQPRKPFLDAEPPYEDLPLRFWDFIRWDQPEPVPPDILDERGLLVKREFFPHGFFDDHDVRVHAYWNLLAGAAGHTYGHNAVWQMHRPGQRAAIPVSQGWREALESPGARQMQNLRRLFESRSLARIQPDQSIVFGENPEGAGHVRAALADDASFVLVYLAEGRAVELVLGKVRGHRVRPTWFDPRTGVVVEAEPISNVDRAVFTPPSTGPKQDWVLVLDSDSAGLPSLSSQPK